MFLETVRGPGQSSRYSDWLRAGRSGDRIPEGGGRDFPHRFRPSRGPTQPPIQWVPGLSRGYCGRGVALTTHPPSSAEVKERVELYLYSTSGPSWPVLGWTLPLSLPFLETVNKITTSRRGQLINVYVIRECVSCWMYVWWNGVYVNSILQNCHLMRELKWKHTRTHRHTHINTQSYSIVI